MTDRTYNVLFLCTGNSSRSIMAESMLSAIGHGRFRAYSAGSHPAGQVNPLAIDALHENRMHTDNLRRKSWDEFAAADAPQMDFVRTVCDNAAARYVPSGPGNR